MTEPVKHRLSGKSAIVTGGSSGIGKAICVNFAQEGASVVVLDIDKQPREGGPDVITLMLQARSNAGLMNTSTMFQFVHGSVEDKEAISHAVDVAKSLTGRLDILVNNAARLSGGHSLLETSEEEWDDFMSSNAKGAFLCTQAAVKTFLEQEPAGPDSIRGRIVNISSQHGIVAARENIAYGCSKAALDYMTRQVAVDYIKDGIVVNAVAPGRVLTGRLGSRPRIDSNSNPVKLPEAEEVDLRASELRTPYANLGRLGKPNDVAKAVSFLASDYASYIVGETLLVDGGYLAY